MCGIAGVFGRVDGATVETMLHMLAHRGPDDEYSVSGRHFTMGARRLSIVDVANGRQPMANENDTVLAVQNGELYNCPRVRTHLLERGHRLKTRCDTEILPHLYEDCGTSFVEQIDGMFAVALWDDVNQVGVLARDRMGKKPLYYARVGEALYFASEIKALLSIPGFTRRVNLHALHHYLSFKHVPHPLSIFEGISILPPAHRLVFRAGKVPEISRYWRLSFAPNENADWTEDEMIERLLALLRRGVERRLMSDVPIGFFLSGGLDSSLSTALAAEISPGRIKTFTLTYAEESTTEGKEQDRRWARWVAEKYNTEHHEETIEFDSFPESIDRIIACFDEPFAGVISTYFLSRLIAKHVKVAISGDAADELFGSYLSHRLAFPMSNYANYRLTGDADLIRPFDDQPGFIDNLVEPEDWAWRSKLLVFADEEKQSLYAPDVAEQLRGVSTRERVREDFATLTARDPLNRVLEAEFGTIFPDQVLTFVDRLSMAHSLEVRTAYLDTDFVTFIASLHGSVKIRNGQTKYLLKQAASRYFPPEMIHRPKEGFLMPITDWILRDLQGYVREVLSPARLSRHGIFDARSVQHLIDRVYQNGSDYRQVNKVLALVIFQVWYERYMASTSRA